MIGISIISIIRHFLRQILTLILCLRYPDQQPLFSKIKAIQNEREINRRIMTPNKKEINSEKTELMAKRQEQKEEKNERFLPIFLWTD